MKHMLFLAVFQAIRLKENEWAKLYDRLVKTKCPYDERTQSYRGKTRVIGRVAGQMTEAIYALLKRDAELLSTVLPGQEPPPPQLYESRGASTTSSGAVPTHEIDATTKHDHPCSSTLPLKRDRGEKRTNPFVSFSLDLCLDSENRKRAYGICEYHGSCTSSGRQR